MIIEKDWTLINHVKIDKLESEQKKEIVLLILEKEAEQREKDEKERNTPKKASAN